MSSLLVRPTSRIAWAFERNAPAAVLLLVAGLPVVAAAWILLTPAWLISAEMTWDLLFNLAGAWHLRFGHVPHIDFHEPVGTLTFLLTQAGFWLVGPSPKAVAAGMVIVAAAIFVMASFAAGRRLPLVPAALFVVFVCLIVLRPANVGDQPNAYSFAMAYNRYGWSGLALLALILFQPAPFPFSQGRVGTLIEMAFVAIVLAALFYLKMTYFAVGMAMLAVAFIASEPMRRDWRGWALVFLIGAALPLLPFNWPYLEDLRGAAQAGIVRDDAAFFFNDFAENMPEYAPYFAAIGIAGWLWHRRLAPARLFIATTFLFLASIALLSQNSQSHGVPLAVVAAFLFCAQFRHHRLPRLLLVLPLASIVSSSTSLVSYHNRLDAGYLRMVDKTNLGGLAVPREPEGLLADVAAGRDRDRLFGRSRAIRPRYELSPYEYVETLMEAVALLEEKGLANGRIAVLDQVDPFPFMFGLEPPHGGNLWSGAGAPTAAPEDYLADADHVLIPRFTTNFAWTETAKATYGAYLAEHFPSRVEGRGWIVLSRADRPR